MANVTDHRRILSLLADTLEYPTKALAEQVRECEGLAAKSDPQAAALLARFRSFVEATPLERVEEVYTGTFDLDAACHPYVGYQLLGESYKRSIFLWELKDRYRAQGYVTSDQELPDRLSVVLRFVAVSQDRELNREIVGEALIPALAAMTKPKDNAEGAPPIGVRPYNDVLTALHRLLQQLEAWPAVEGEACVAGGSQDG